MRVAVNEGIGVGVGVFVSCLLLSGPARCVGHGVTGPDDSACSACSSSLVGPSPLWRRRRRVGDVDVEVLPGDDGDGDGAVSEGRGIRVADILSIVNSDVDVGACGDGWHGECILNYVHVHALFTWKAARKKRGGL
jgi:hypothetical protein